MTQFKILTSFLTILIVQLFLAYIGNFKLALVVNGIMLLFYALLYKIFLLSTNAIAAELVEKRKEITGDKFHKILIKCIDDEMVLNDENWSWSIEKLGDHKYHVIGNHPVAARIDSIKDKIVV